jgi:hypothetical protein
MTYTPAVFVPQQYVENTATKKYTGVLSGAGGRGFYIDKAVFANPTTNSATVTIHIVAPAGSVGDATKVIPATVVPPGGVLSLHDLAGRFNVAGSEIWWTASAATTITGAISGREVS